VRRLTVYPAVSRVYKRLITEMGSDVVPVTIDTVLQGRGDGWVAGSHTVPGVFTIEGYNSYMREAIETAAADVGREDWVMGPMATAVRGQGVDSDRLRAMYFGEYTAQWQKFVKGMSIRPYTTKEDAVEALETFSANDSPIAKVMAEVERNTNFSSASRGGIIAWLKGLVGKGGGEGPTGNTEVEREFRPLSPFVSPGDGEKTSAMSEYRRSLGSVAEALEGRIETRGTAPAAVTLVWPARPGAQSGARITVIAEGGQDKVLSFPGGWGVFRMFEAGGGRSQKTTDNQFALVWNVGGVPVRATLRPSSATNPFDRGLFTPLRAPQSMQ
jgi:type VI protein secretion system component VasK